MTQLSPTMTEGTIVKWIKKEGDSVSPGEILAEVETDKAVMEMEAYESGVLLKILEQEGSKLSVGSSLAIIGKPGEDIAGLLQDIAQKKKESPKAGADNPPASTPTATATATATPIPVAVVNQVLPTPPPPVVNLAPPPSQGLPPLSKNGKARVLASPLAKRLALESGVDLHALIGTGPEGRVTKKDILDFVASRGSVRPNAPLGITQTVRVNKSISLGGMRKTIAKRLTDSKQNLPHFYLTSEIQAKELEKFREDINASRESFYGKEAPKVSINDILIKAVAASLRFHPDVNASWNGDSILQHGRIDIGVAVSLEGGLLTPVVRNADQKSVFDIAMEVKDLAKKARDRKLKPEEFTNGTFTISNLGMYGITRFTAIINDPESAILAVGGIQDQPVIENGAVVPGRVLSLTLSCDHRVIDGAVGAEFLRTLKKFLEKPSLLASF